MATSTIKNNLALLTPYKLVRSSSAVASFTLNGTVDVQDLGTYTATDNGLLQVRVGSGTQNLDLKFLQINDNQMRESFFQPIWMPAYWDETVILIPMKKDVKYSVRCKRAAAVSVTNSYINFFTLTAPNT